MSKWAPVIAAAISALVGMGQWANSRALDALGGTMASLDARVGRIEGRLMAGGGADSDLLYSTRARGAGRVSR